MKFLVIILLAACFITFVPNVSATLFENQEVYLRDKSQTHSIILEFTDDEYDVFLKKNVPVINNGLLQIKGVSIPLTNGDTKVMMFGTDSFSIKSEYFVLYGNAGLESFRMYFFDGQLKKINLEKFNLPKLVTTPTETSIPSQTVTETTSTEEQELKQMVIAERHPLIGYLENTYSFTIKAFDAKQNPNKEFSSSSGLLTEYTVTGKIKDSQGKVIKTITGSSNSNNGIFQGQWYVPYLSKLGSHTLEVKVFSDGYLPITQSMNFFVDNPIVHDGNSTSP